ncbi:hypothetical protein CSAL01_05908 [Colletotrichum salicis]|uniref:Uncharacterized protein n=1 Tax=Colletotrichum salicis TaxID=1209931 RepID=A0A135UBJ9_9PEZI|nr:hypothetical protein CSAL01_05908 [Colletotrichum salicis]
MTSTPTPVPQTEPASSDGSKPSTTGASTTKPDTPNPGPQENNNNDSAPENYFATWYLINLAALAAIGSLSVRPPPTTGTEEGKVLLAVFATILFFVSGLGLIMMAYDVWPRTGHQRLLGSLLGVTAALIYGITAPSWTVGVGQTLGREFCLLSGFHVGFWIEGVTGLMGLVLKALKNSKEEPLPRKIIAAGGDVAKAQPSSSSSAAQN